ncbi:hypothetical protein [[Eubacterium] hominis]
MKRMGNDDIKFIRKLAILMCSISLLCITSCSQQKEYDILSVEDELREIR